MTITEQAPPTAPEAPDPEPVEPTPPEVAAEEHADERPGAEIVRYERPTAMIPGIDLPVIPDGSEMKNIAALAVTLAGAAAVPRALQGKPNDVFQVLLTARDLGVALTTAMREFHVIDGRVTLSPKVKLAMVNERGQREGWAIWPDPDNDELSATWYATRADRPGLTFHSTFTLQQAKLAKLDGKDNWKSYPQRMVSWRALGYLLDDVFPEVATGIYSPDELGGMTDAEGNYIEVSATEPLHGMKAPRGSGPAGDPDGDLAPEDDRFLLACRIAALPDESREALRERWKANGTLTGVRVDDLNHRGTRAAAAMLAGIENEAKRHDWDMPAAHEAVRLAVLALNGTPEAPDSPQAAPTGDDAPDAAADPPGATGATGAPLGEVQDRAPQNRGAQRGGVVDQAGGVDGGQHVPAGLGGAGLGDLPRTTRGQSAGLDLKPKENAVTEGDEVGRGGRTDGAEHLEAKGEQVSTDEGLSPGALSGGVGEHGAQGTAGGPDQTPEERFTGQEQVVIDEVKALSLPRVDTELRRLHGQGRVHDLPESGDPVEGSGQERRGRLAASLLAERHPELFQ